MDEVEPWDVETANQKMKWRMIDYRFSIFCHSNFPIDGCSINFRLVRPGPESEVRAGSRLKPPRVQPPSGTSPASCLATVAGEAAHLLRHVRVAEGLHVRVVRGHDHRDHLARDFFFRLGVERVVQPGIWPAAGGGAFGSSAWQCVHMTPRLSVNVCITACTCCRVQFFGSTLMFSGGGA